MLRALLAQQQPGSTMAEELKVKLEMMDGPGVGKVICTALQAAEVQPALRPSDTQLLDTQATVATAGNDTQVRLKKLPRGLLQHRLE